LAQIAKMLVKIRKMQIPAKDADQGSNHQANCCLQPYEYSQPVTIFLHSVGTGLRAFMKSSEPSAPQHPTCKKY